MPLTDENSTVEQQQLAPWMSLILKGAGVYNLCWGAWVVLFPVSSMKFCGYAAPATYPELWQCIGMIVGVYGIGYWIAAGDPVRHWPIVLVGFLGKVLGPLGFLYAWSLGRLPLSAGVVNIFNDLIWLIPFAMILWRALRFEQTRSSLAVDELSFREAIEIFHCQQGSTIAELSHQQRLMVVFLRHSGCTFCRETLAEIRNNRDEIEASGINIAFVHMSSEAEGKTLFERYGVADLPRFSDPQQRLYHAAEIGLGRFGQLLSWRVLSRGFRTAILKRHGFSAVKNNVFRMSGTLLIKDGEILKRYQPRDASDHPDYCQFVQDVSPGG